MKTYPKSAPPRPPKAKNLKFQALLQQNFVDVWRIGATNDMWFCRHRPTSSECLLCWWDNSWQLSGAIDSPALRVVSELIARGTGRVTNG